MSAGAAAGNRDNFRKRCDKRHARAYVRRSSHEITSTVTASGNASIRDRPSPSVGVAGIIGVAGIVGVGGGGDDTETRRVCFIRGISDNGDDASQ
jgi:ElaB/YqjD/DUF883 family membrane-anchored ribosome-binding protein